MFTRIKNFFSTYKEIVKIAWRVRRDLLIGVTIINTIDGLTVLPSLYIGKLLIDTVIHAVASQDVSYGIKNIALLLVAEFGVYIVRYSVQQFDWTFSSTLSRSVNVYIQSQAMAKINSLPVAQSEDPKHRDIFKKIFDTGGNRVWGLIMPISSIPKNVASLISSGIIVFNYQPLFILLGALLALPEIVVGNLNSKAEYDLTTRQAKIWRVWNAYEEFISKGRYLYENKILGHIQELVNRLNAIANKSFAERHEMHVKSNQRSILSYIPLRAFNSVATLFLFYQAILQKITLGTAQMVSSAINQFAWDVAGLINQASRIYEHYLFVQDYLQFVSLPDETQQPALKKIRLPFQKGVVFKNVWFKYPNAADWVIRNASFKIDIKENIALVGENGAGKTTLIKLLCRFYTPQKGNIWVNGVDIQNVSPTAYRKTISALFQDFAQYPFSAQENIWFGDIDSPSTGKEIKKAAHITEIDDFIESLPTNYKNPLDNEFEGGIEPSKGQWQRIALARAVFRKSQILVLDEPTSNIDPEAEEQIFDQLIRQIKDRIMILVSHRFSTVRRADKILVLDKGKIVEQGSHEQLMQLDGKYAHLFNLQAKSYQ